MAQYKINVDSEILHQLFLGNSKDAGVNALLESVLNQVLLAQASDQLGAGKYERSNDRKGYRNGSYPHQLTTRVGPLTLRVPRLRNGDFSTDLFARYQRSGCNLAIITTIKITHIVAIHSLCLFESKQYGKIAISQFCHQKLFLSLSLFNNEILPSSISLSVL